MVKLSHTSGTMHALLLLGSNKGDAYALLQSAIGSLSAEMALVEKGSVYQTAAWGFEGPPFLNQVIEVRFKGSAHALLAACLAIEVEHGRVRNPAVEGYESRSMDIDILLIANEVVDSETLKVPHPRMLERRFVMMPLAEKWSSWTHPLKNQHIAALFLACTDEIDVDLWENLNTFKA